MPGSERGKLRAAEKATRGTEAAGAPSAPGWGREGVRVDAQCRAAQPPSPPGSLPPGLPEAFHPPNPSSVPRPPALNERNLPCSPWGPVGRKKGAVRSRAALAKSLSKHLLSHCARCYADSKTELGISRKGGTDRVHSVQPYRLSHRLQHSSEATTANWPTQ